MPSSVTSLKIFRLTHGPTQSPHILVFQACSLFLLSFSWKAVVVGVSAVVAVAVVVTSSLLQVFLAVTTMMMIMMIIWMVLLLMMTTTDDDDDFFEKCNCFIIKVNH